MLQHINFGLAIACMACLVIAISIELLARSPETGRAGDTQFILAALWLVAGLTLPITTAIAYLS